MRIVMAANWWYRRGGIGTVMLDEKAELEKRGHEVIPFASRHPDNLPTPWERYFPGFRETSDLGASLPVGARVGMALRLLRNREAAGALSRLIDDTNPDVIHLHNAVRQLSPSILRVARAKGLGIVMSQHDYSLVCPQGQMLKGERVSCVAPNCIRGNTTHAIVNRCIRRRLLPSIVAAGENGLHRARGSYLSRADLFLAPSRFLQNLLIEGGVPASKVRLLVNGLDPGDRPADVPSSGGHILYAGRLAREKGLDVLLEASKLAPEIDIVIAGDGPSRAALVEAAGTSVRFVGHVSGEELTRLRAESVAVASPSIWYENAPMGVLEAMRDGRPAIVTAIGGQGEMIDPDSGLLVPPRDAEALAAAMRRLWRDRSTAQSMGMAGRARLVSSFALVDHVSRLEEFYLEAAASATDRPIKGRRAHDRTLGATS